MFHRRNVVLFDRELGIVERVREEMGFSPRSGFSEAVRFIIRDWARMRGYRGEESEGREGQAKKEPHKGG